MNKYKTVNNYKTMITVTVIVCLVSASCGDWATTLRAGTLANPTLARQSTYKTKGAPNTDEARRVAAGLGVGKHVAVKVTSGKTFRGNLQAINENHLVLLPDGETQTMEIAYADVQELGPDRSIFSKIPIGVVVGVAIFSLALIVALKESLE